MWTLRGVCTGAPGTYTAIDETLVTGSVTNMLCTLRTQQLWRYLKTANQRHLVLGLNATRTPALGVTAGIAFFSLDDAL